MRGGARRPLTDITVALIGVGLYLCLPIAIVLLLLRQRLRGAARHHIAGCAGRRMASTVALVAVTCDCADLAALLGVAACRVA